MKKSLQYYKQFFTNDFSIVSTYDPKSKQFTTYYSDSCHTYEVDVIEGWIKLYDLILIDDREFMSIIRSNMTKI